VALHHDMLVSAYLCTTVFVQYGFNRGVHQRFLVNVKTTVTSGLISHLRLDFIKIV